MREIPASVAALRGVTRRTGVQKVIEDPVAREERADTDTDASERREGEALTLLTATELLVLQLFLLGYSASQIAALLAVDDHAVRETATSAAAHAGAADWHSAAVHLQRRGLLA